MTNNIAVKSSVSRRKIKNLIVTKWLKSSQCGQRLHSTKHVFCGGNPPRLQGFSFCFRRGSWRIRCMFFLANLRGFLLPHPPISHLSVKVSSIYSGKDFSTGSGSSVTVPVGGRCRGGSRLRGCYGYPFLISTMTVHW